MKKLFSMVLLSIVVLFFAACAKIFENKSVEKQSVSVHKYKCKSNEIITAIYLEDEAKINYKGNSYHMKIAPSASGSRYTGANMQWWTKGSEAGSSGTLFLNESLEKSKIIEKCVEK